ncbi:unnamed protein product [Rhizoctonia solani]|uniref:CHAT domain-containing protein n=1 Tax=Rhizoctonia solani TaxID=456999 RepID=A0A8H3H6R7_9AGAM|nr:unnamed protein product [Rhizoctonia solani]
MRKPGRDQEDQNWTALVSKAIEYGTQALDISPNNAQTRPIWLGNLAIFYIARVERLGKLDDLERAIELEYQALALTPDGDPDLSSRHIGLGVSPIYQFRSLGELNDLEKSIKHSSCALALTPDGHPNMPGLLSSLGVAYGDRFRHLGELDDLEKSLEHEAHALVLSPNGDSDLARRHGHLGVSYTNRFERLGELHDLEESIRHLSRALVLTPDDHPSLPGRLYDQARNCFLQYKHTGDTSHMNRSLDFFRTASQLSTGAPRKAFWNALQWAILASKHSSLQCIEAYQVTLDLLPHFIWLGASNSQRYWDLSTTQNLAVQAASAAILHSDFNLALEWLEQAQCVVWNQSLGLCSPLGQLQSAHPDLGTRLQAISKQLHDASSALPTGSINSGDAGQHHQRANKYHELLAQTGKLSGFEDFLEPMKANRLVHAARNGPIVVINCHEARCDALLIMPHQSNINHIYLPNFTGEKARHARSEIETSLQYQRLRERGVWVLQGSEWQDTMDGALAVLWQSIVKPVLDFLGYMESVLTDRLPHITWCPTGSISFLLLHAAGDYNQPRSRVSNYAVSSYTPTLAALLASSSSSLNRTFRVLAIGQANTPGHTPLPGTTKELECLKVHTQNTAEYSQLTNDQAITAAVLDAMEQHDWVHLACHAHQNVDNPTKSGFFLHDGTLDLAAINRRSFKNKGLAFLSACQTATGDEKLPDKAIHLASGMLMAGYPSVIATMWSVMDNDAPFVADKVYAELMKDGKVGNGEAGRALHKAVAALRNEVGEKAFARWVPYIHIGS